MDCRRRRRTFRSLVYPWHCGNDSRVDQAATHDVSSARPSSAEDKTNAHKTHRTSEHVCNTALLEDTWTGPENSYVSNSFSFRMRCSQNNSLVVPRDRDRELSKSAKYRHGIVCSVLSELSLWHGLGHAQLEGPITRYASQRHPTHENLEDL
jgi:hypothetical protein